MIFWIPPFGDIPPPSSTGELIIQTVFAVFWLFMTLAVAYAVGVMFFGWPMP